MLQQSFLSLFQADAPTEGDSETTSEAGSVNAALRAHSAAVMTRALVASVLRASREPPCKWTCDQTLTPSAHVTAQGEAQPSLTRILRLGLASQHLPRRTTRRNCMLNPGATWTSVRVQLYPSRCVFFNRTPSSLAFAYAPRLSLSFGISRLTPPGADLPGHDSDAVPG